MTNSNQKGDRRERELTNWMDENGWAVIRIPASGSATQRDLPDLLAGNSVYVVAVEVKSSSGKPIYLSGEEIDALERFASRFGADPYVAVKFDLSNGDPAYGEDRPGFYFIPTYGLHQTDGGNYRVKKETAQEHGTPEEAL